MTIVRLSKIAGIAAFSVMGFAGTGLAQDYPTDSISFFVPFSPGGGTDFASRMLTEALSRQQGWNFVIENRPGAGGNIGLSQVAQAAPDGYVLGMGQTSNMAINPSLYDDMPYDSLTAFTPITVVSSQPTVIAVPADSPFETFEDLVEAARAEPGNISMSTAGSGTAGHLALELFSQIAEIEFLHIPYPGAAQAITDTIGAHVEFTANSLPSVLSHVQSGSLRALAVTSAERNAVLPDVPSVAEFGYDDFDTGDWKAVVGPAGLPDEIVETLSIAINQALEDEELRAVLEAEGSDVIGGTPEEFSAFLEAEVIRWAEIVELSGATIE